MGALLLSRLTTIEPGAVTAHVAGRADLITTAEALARVRHGDTWATYAVNGLTGDDTVRLEIGPTGWAGSCTHYDRLGIGQARKGARACSHVLAAARNEARLRGCEIPDPTRPAAVEAPADPAARAAWRAQRAAEMRGFYD